MRLSAMCSTIARHGPPSANVGHVPRVPPGVASEAALNPRTQGPELRFPTMQHRINQITYKCCESSRAARKPLFTDKSCEPGRATQSTKSVWQGQRATVPQILWPVNVLEEAVVCVWGGGGSLGPEFQEGPSEGHLTLVCWSVSVLGDLLKFWKGPPALEKCWRARDAWKYCRQILRNSCGHPNNTCGKNNSRHKQRPTTVSADIMRQSKGNSVVILWTILRTVLRKSCGKSFGEPRGAL